MIEAGTRLPSLKLPDATEQVVTSEDLAGRWAVLFFYPKDHTPG